MLFTLWICLLLTELVKIQELSGMLILLLILLLFCHFCYH